MATESENILLEIEFNSADIQKNVQAIVNGRSAIDQLIEANKKLAAQGEKNSVAYVQNEQAIKKLNAGVAANSKVIQANTQANQVNANSLEALKKRNSELLKERDKLDASTEEGRKAIAKLNLEYDKNSKIIAANSTKVEQQKFNIGKYKEDILAAIPGLGQFTSIIGDSTGKLTSAKKATEGMSLATKLLLGPIGLLILAGTAIINFLTGSEEGMDTLAKVTAKVQAVLSVLKNTLVGVGSALVAFVNGNFSEGIDKLTNSFFNLGGRISDAIDNASELADIFDTLDELRLRNQVRNDEEENAIKNLIIQSRSRNKTEKERFDLLQQAAELEKRITGEKLGLQLASINASTRQLLVDADRLDLAQKEGETTVEFTKRIIAEQSLLFGKRKELADQLKEYNSLLDNQANVQEKIQIQQDGLAEKQAEAAAKRAEAEKKRLEEIAAKQEELRKREETAENKLEILRLEREVKQLQGIDERTDKLIEIEQTKAEQLLENQKLTESERQLIVAQSEDAINEILKQASDSRLTEDQARLNQALEDYKFYVDGLVNEKKRELLEARISQEEYDQEIADLALAAQEVQLAIKEQFGEQDLALEGRIIDAKLAQKKFEADETAKLEKFKLDAVQSTLGQVASLFNKNSVAFKALASAQTLIQTFQSAQAVFTGMTSTIPGPVGVALGIAGALAATLSGIARVNEINKTKIPKLAEGGLIDIDGKSHAQGGEDVYIGRKRVANVQGGEKMVIMKREASPLLRNLSNINALAGGRDFFNDRVPRYYQQDGGFVSRAIGNQVSSFQNLSIAEDLKKIKIFTSITELDRVREFVNKANFTSELS